MEVVQAIFTRRSVPVVKPDPIPHDVVEFLLACAVQAPNHHHVRPWRFVVIQGTARERLGDIFAEVMHDQFPELPEAALIKERSKPLRAPLLIAVGVDLPEDPRVLELENICAAAAATQNLLLAAHSLGLAGMWRTGKPALSPQVKTFLGLKPEQPLIAFLYIGYPTDKGYQSIDRPSAHDRTVWLDDHIGKG